MKYTDLIFDLYGTLVDIHTEESTDVWNKTALFFGYYGAHYTAAELRSAFEAALSAQEAAAGQNYECYPDIPIEKIMSQLFIQKGVCANADSLAVSASQLFRICATEYIKLYDGVLHALSKFTEKGYRLWLLSNAQRVFTEFELQHLGLNHQFHETYISSDHGCRKPDTRFLGALLQQQNLNPETCLMIGNDRNTDIAGAKAMGLATLYLHSNITPPGQAAADPEMHPAKAPTECRHFEYAGTDWHDLCAIICKHF